MTKSFTIQLARTTDAPDTALLCSQLGYPTDEASVAGRLASILDDRTQLLRVAKDEAGRVVGWVHALPVVYLESEPFIEIGGLVVDASCRREGVGRQLMTAVEEWARDQGYGVIRLRSNVIREEAHRFYASIGYQQVKQQFTFVKEL